MCTTALSPPLRCRFLRSRAPGARPARRVPRPARGLLPLAALLPMLLPAMPAQAADALPVVTETVVVTATRHAMLALDAPAAMSVVTAQELQARGADDLLDALRGETGVSLQGRSIGGRKVLSLRGMDSKHTLFLVDGRRIGASDGVIGHSDFQYDWIAVDDIERIEVVRGPLSVLFGSEAMGGVVNVITRQAGDQWRRTARVEGSVAEGSRGGDGHRAGFSLGGPLAGGWSLRAGLAQSRRAATASAADPRLSELEGHAKTDGWLALGWRPAAGQRLDLEHRAGSETRRADARERSGARRYHVTENDLERRMTAFAWEADWAAGPLTQLRAYETMLDVSNMRSAGVAVNPPQRLQDRVLEGQAGHTLGDHALTAGFEARNESLRDPGLPGGRSLAQHRSLYLQDEFALTRRLQLTAGLRHDRHSLFGSERSPRAYLVWRAGGGWVVKGGYSHGFKAPNLKQIVPGARREGPNSFLGNPALRPETSDAVEAGAAWAGAGSELQLMLFEQRIADLIEVRLVAPGPAPGIGTYTYDNLQRARLRGLEASAARRLGAGFSTQLSWTWLDARDGDGRRLERRPRHALGARLDWQQGPWQAGLRADHSSGQWLPSTTVGAPAQAAPSLTQLGASVSRRLPGGLQASLVVDNLTDLQPAERSPLYTHAEPRRSWRLTLRGSW
ncbi:MAG: TonB-dependent receptor [Rubrivivax sp.]|nr:TonB-dependent receptor [Rubrivivax sp.]